MIFATTVQVSKVMVLGAPPVYTYTNTIVRYPVKGLEITGICIKMWEYKNRPFKNIKYGYDFSPAQGVCCAYPVWLSTALLCSLFLFPPSSLSLVWPANKKARVVRQQKERTDERIRKLRRSRVIVIGDCGGYRRLIVYFAVFGREGLARKGSC